MALLAVFGGAAGGALALLAGGSGGRHGSLSAARGSAGADGTHGAGGSARGGSAAAGAAGVPGAPRAAGVPGGTGATGVAARSAAPPAPRHPPFRVGIILLKFTDTHRTVALPGDPNAPRTLLTSIRYPALGLPDGREHPLAASNPAGGPYPLVIFGHGFALSPGPYARLLDAWASAGFVVVAPLFPAGNANAPGGPNENDLPNQAGDMSFLITRMLAANSAATGRLHGLLDPAAIAVTGQSDGGDTALAAAYDPRYRDRRVRAAVILSGAEDPFVSSFTIQPGGPPLLATQGTADTINLPSATTAFYDPAPPPKYLLQLLGADHLGPYTDGQPALGVVERVTTAFLDGYLKNDPAALHAIARLGNLPGVATFSASP